MKNVVLQQTSVQHSVPRQLRGIFKDERIWIDYNESAYVLDISFQKPLHANDSIMEDNLVYHYCDIL